MADEDGRSCERVTRAKIVKKLLEGWGSLIGGASRRTEGRTEPHPQVGAGPAGLASAHEEGPREHVAVFFDADGRAGMDGRDGRGPRAEDSVCSHGRLGE